MLSWTIFSLLFLLPFLILPFGASFFETPKVVVFQTAVLFLAIFLSTNNPKATFLANSKVSRLIFLGMVILSIAQLFLGDSAVSFFGNVIRLQGIFLLWLLILWAVISPAIALPKVPFWVFSLLIFLHLAAAVLIQGDTYRSIGTLGEPNTLAATVVFLWPFLLFVSQVQGKWSKILIALSLVVVIFIELITGSRSGLIAIVIQVIFLGLLKIQRLPLFLVVLFCVLLMGLSMMLPFLEKDLKFENRVVVWQTALVAGEKQPLFGSGFGAGEKVLNKTAKELANNLQYQYVDDAHNLFLNWFVQGGLLGVGLLIALLSMTFYSLIKKRRVLELTCLVGVLTMM